jgi:hypothetical protein
MRKLCLWFALLLVLAAAPARAEFKIDSPDFGDAGVIGWEHAGSASRHPSGELSYVTSLSYTPTDWLLVEVEGAWAREPGGPSTTFQGTAAVATLELLDEERAGIALGFKGEYLRAWPSGLRDAVKFGPLLGKEIGPVQTTLNLFLERELGGGSSRAFEFTYGAQVAYEIRPELTVALEAFGAPGHVDEFAAWHEQQHRLGPVLSGEFDLGLGGLRLGYEAGYLFGVTRGTPDGTWKWLVSLALPL